MGCKLGPRDVVLVFTDDPKFDEPALTGALGAAGRSGESLRATSRPIHGDTEPADAIDTEDGP